MQALLEVDYTCSMLNVRDLYQHTALEYAMAMLVRWVVWSNLVEV
jgi:hypothetical protein